MGSRKLEDQEARLRALQGRVQAEIRATEDTAREGVSLLREIESNLPWMEGPLGESTTYSRELRSLLNIVGASLERVRAALRLQRHIERDQEGGPGDYDSASEKGVDEPPPLTPEQITAGMGELTA